MINYGVWLVINFLNFSLNGDMKKKCHREAPSLCVLVNSKQLIDHFTVVCLVAWPLNESETGVDLVLIETSLLFLC